MLAIVLTFDKYRVLAEHMLHRYDRLWPDHPFYFRIPYQDLRGADSPRLHYVKTPAAIKDTVLTLLDDLENEQWIYWCIDDKYPIALDLPQIMSIAAWTSDNHKTCEFSGAMFCRCRALLRAENLTGEKIIDDHGRVYLERKAYHQIWIHQFLRVKVLRHLFESFPDIIDSAKSMDAMLLDVEKPSSHRIFVTQDNFAIFGESTSRGLITKNCYDSIVENNLTLPEWCPEPTDRTITMGELKIGW